ncbi:MAG: ComEC/Rec2 family competence protein [Treponema sp.]
MLSIKTFVLAFVIIIGAFIANIGYIRLIVLASPITSLAETKKIEKITVILTEDATPRGHKYYKARANILLCKYKDGSSYSSNGNITIFLPSIFITQNYMGGSISNKHSNINMFCKGIKIEISGHFSKNSSFNSQAFFVSDKADVIFLCWQNKIFLYRTHLRFLINRLLYGWGKAGYLLLALLTANKDFISLEDVSSFRKAGLSHVLALSGMHLAVIGLISAYFASFLLNKRTLKLFLIATSFAFLVFAGASPSLIRAFLMLTIIAIAKLLYAKIDLLGVLCFTFSIHLVLFPEDSLTLSFMLSYGALFGILACSKAIFYFLNPFIPDILNGSLSASLGATFFTTPIIALSIKQVSFIGIISTCIISPLISIFLIIGLIFIILSLIFPSLYEILGSILNLFYSLIINIVYFFSSFPILKMENISYTISFIPLIFAILIIYFYKLKRKEQLDALIF